jgi:hypothetical protein
LHYASTRFEYSLAAEFDPKMSIPQHLVLPVWQTAATRKNHAPYNSVHINSLRGSSEGVKLERALLTGTRLAPESELRASQKGA